MYDSHVACVCFPDRAVYVSSLNELVPWHMKLSQLRQCFWPPGCPSAKASIGSGGQLWASALLLPGVVGVTKAGLEMPDDVLNTVT